MRHSALTPVRKGPGQGQIDLDSVTVFESRAEIVYGNDQRSSLPDPVVLGDERLGIVAE